MLPQTLLACLSAFEPCFTAPSYQRFTVMMSGWLLCVGKRTITGVMRSAGVADMHPSGFHRFFSQGAWAPDDVGRVVLQLALGRIPAGQRVMLTDNAYVNHTVVAELPQNIELVGRGRMDAALYAPPPPYSGKGRPRVKGKRLDTPKQRADKGRFKKLDVIISGRRARVRVQVFNALWYKVGGGRRMRFVTIVGWPGHAKDDVLVSTDLTLGAKDIIQGYCRRWSIEETFGWAKSRLGLEDAQNRTEHAVHRTTPMALWAYSLVVIWYANNLQRRRTMPFRCDRWYQNKVAPSFADMLASMRRDCWTVWVSDQAQKGSLDQKSLAPLLDIAGYG